MPTYPINLKDDLKGWVKNSKKLMPPRLGTHAERGFGVDGREWFKFGYQSDPKVGTGNTTSIYRQDPVVDHPTPPGVPDVFFGHGCYRLKTPSGSHNFGEVDRGGNSPNAGSDIEKLQDSCVLPGIIDSTEKISHKNCQGFLMIEDAGSGVHRGGQVCFQSGCEDNQCLNSSKGLVNDWSQEDARYQWKRLAGSVGGRPALDTNNYRAVMHEYIDVEKIVTVADVGVGEIFWNNYDIYEPKKMQAEGPSGGSTWWSGCTINLTPLGHESGTDPTLSTVEPASAFTGVVPMINDWLFGVAQEAHITAADMTWADSTIGRATGWGMRAAGSAGQSPVAPHINDNFPWPFFEYTSDNARKFTMQPYSGDSQKNMGVFTNPSQISASRKGFRGEYPGPEEVALGYPNLSISQAMRKCNEMDGCAGFIMYENDWEGGLAGTPESDNNLNGNLFPSNANGQHDPRGWELVDLALFGEPNANAVLNTISGNHSKYYSNFVIFVDDFGAGVGNEAPPPDMRPANSDVLRLPSRVFVKKPRPSWTREPEGQVDLSGTQTAIYGACEPAAATVAPASADVPCTDKTAAECAAQAHCVYKILPDETHTCYREKGALDQTNQTMIDNQCNGPIEDRTVACPCLATSKIYHQKVLDNCMIRSQYNEARLRKRKGYENIQKSYAFVDGTDHMWGGDGDQWLNPDPSSQPHNANIHSEHPGWIAEFDDLLRVTATPIIAVPPVPDEQMVGLHGDIQLPTCCINSVQATGGHLSDINQCMICPGGLSDAEQAAAVAACHLSATPASGTPASGTPASGAPASGTPASGAPASGAPASGAPASGTGMNIAIAIAIGIVIVICIFAVFWFLKRVVGSFSNSGSKPQISPGGTDNWSTLTQPLL
tara:strand:- start:1319 stop:3970 length:2652 start_codon:yes stop_codon:yes gene_type:complete